MKNTGCEMYPFNYDFIVKSCLIGILFLTSLMALGQEDTVRVNEGQAIFISDTLIIPENDTVFLVPDGEIYETISMSRLRSQRFFDSLEAKASKSKVTSRLYKLLVDYRRPQDALAVQEPVKSESYFDDYKGKTIRKINYINVDLFGGSVRNPERKANNDLQRYANKFHIATQYFVIRKHLLFEKGDSVDVFKLSDSERIIRSLPFIRDVRIEPEVIDSVSDQIDVTVIVRDRLSWSLNGGFTDFNKYNITAKNNNVAGTGNEIQGGFRHWNEAAPQYGYESALVFRNVQRSFIDLSVLAENTYRREWYAIKLSKNFLSPFQKYNGEFLMDRITQNIYPPEWDSVQYYERNRLDTWLSRSFRIGERQNFGVSGRYVNHHFFRRPEVKSDSNEVFHNRQTILGSIFLSQTNFYKTRNILSFNITEDVPVGFISSVVIGRNWSEFDQYYYSGIHLGAGTFRKWGYLRADIRAGNFFNQVGTKNIIVNPSLGYFTPLARIGGSQVRTFLRLNYFRSRDLSFPIARGLNDVNGIRDLRGFNINGETAFIRTIESVVFLPFYFYGFQFAPFAFTDWGYVEETRLQEPYYRTYNNVGGGVRTKNENLIFDAFEIRFTYFPSFPEFGDEFILSFSFTRPLFFRSFNVSKPVILAYD